MNLMAALQKGHDKADKEVNDREKHYRYLDKLRESGVTNMYGATPYLQRQFSLDKEEARDILADWMETFSERHNKGAI
jgi:uncharacterized protein YciI